MRLEKAAMTMPMKALLVLCLVITTATALIPTTIVSSQSQLANPGIQSPLSQQVAVARASSSSSLTAEWVKQDVYASYCLAVVADVDGDAKPEILVSSWYTLYCLSGTGDLKWAKYEGGYLAITPAVADINGDGRMEIVVTGGSSRRIFFFDGSGVLGWVIENINASFSACSPTIADVDQDGKPEILVGSDIDGQGFCRLFCINGGGAVEWSYLVEGSYSAGSLSSGPTAADIQGDGTLEVVVTGGNKTYCLSGVGASMWNFTAPGGAMFSPAVADVDGDGKKEVIIGHEDGRVYCLNASGVPKWNYTTGSANYLSSNSVADIDGDGKPEIFFSNKEVLSQHSGIIYCLNGTGGLEWLSTPGGAVYGPPVAADVDLDSGLEVVFGTSYSSWLEDWAYGGVVYCFESSGRAEWTYATSYYGLSNPLAIADIDLDGRPEIIAPTGDGVFCLSAFPEPMPSMPGSLLLVLLGLSLALISITAVSVVRRSGGVQTESIRRRTRRRSGQRR